MDLASDIDEDRLHIPESIRPCNWYVCIDMTHAEVETARGLGKGTTVNVSWVNSRVRCVSWCEQSTLPALAGVYLTQATNLGERSLRLVLSLKHVQLVLSLTLTSY